MAKIIIILIACSFGMMMLWVGLTQHARQRRLLREAMPVEAVILESGVSGSKSTDTDPRVLRSTSTNSYTPLVRFKYRVQGISYESAMLYPTIIERGYASPAAAKAQVQDFPAGATVQAFVDPSQPDKAFLKREEGAGPVVFVIVGLLVPVLGAVLSKWA